MATIITKFSSTASAVPTSSDLVQGELAVNTADKRLFTEDSGATVIELGTNPSSVTTGNIVGSGTLAITGASTFTGNVTASNDLSIGGNLTVTGNATISGNLTFGDADTDSIALNADVDSHILPNTDDTYDLGSTTKEWRNLYIDGTANIDSLVADTADINGGTVDGAIIGASSAAAGTFTTATATTGNITTVNATTVDSTNVEVTNLKAKDGTASATIADVTGVITIPSSVLTTTDINGGTIDGAVIGGSSAAAGSFTTISASGTITGPSGTWDAGGVDIATGDTYAINSVDVLSATTLGSSVVNSSLTSLGTITSLVATTADINGGTIDGAVIGGSSAAAITGTTITGTSFVSSGNMTFGDNNKAIFGAGSDLQIYHNGSNSFIEDTGTGNLYIRAANQLYIQGSTANEMMAQFQQDGTVALYYNNSVKLATTSTGIDVTGTATMDGLTVDGDASVITLNNTDTSLSLGQTLGEIKFNQNDPSDQGVGTVASIEVENKGVISGYGQFNFKTGSATSLLDRLSIAEGGDISFYEDTGTTPKFFWDASAESLGIGTSSPLYLVDLTFSNSDLYTTSSFPTANNNLRIFNSNSTVGTDASILLRTGGDTASNNAHAVISNVLTSANNSALTFKTESSGSLAERLRIDSSGNVGIGVTPSSWWSGAKTLQIGSGASLFGSSTVHQTILGANYYYNGTNNVYIGTGQASLYSQLSGTHVWSYAASGTAGTAITFSEAMRIDSSGNVGIGTSSPAAKIEISGVKNTSELRLSSTTNDASWSTNEYFGKLSFYSGDSSGAGAGIKGSIISAQAGGGGSTPHMSFNVASTTSNEIERMRIDSSGNVGIGTSSPSKKLVISDNGAMGVEISPDDGGNGYSRIINYDRTTNQYEPLRIEGEILQFSTGTTATEKARIDSSGNLLVGKTSSALATVGVEAQADGDLWATADSRQALSLRRNTTDGNIANFWKDGTTVGSIGSEGGDSLYIVSGDTGLRFVGGVDSIVPSNANGAARDAAIDIGYSSQRFKDLYLSGGVYVGGTTSSNLLDDYEEGTWTPAYSPESGSFSSITYNEQNGTYIKIGRLVVVNFDIRTNDVTVGTASGNLYISGLPFATDGSQATGQCGAQGSWVTNAPEYLNLQDGSTYGFLRYTDGAGYGGINVSNMTTGASTGANRILGCSIAYYTNS